jgi:5-methylcytosine-specific restriction endonuclease McrA
MADRKRKPGGLFSTVFHRDGHCCVYCRKNMLQDFDTFWTAQLDRLVPKGDYVAENVVLACFVCNNLRGNRVPSMSLSPDNRETYIDAVTQLINERREAKRGEFSSWLPADLHPLETSAT